jgi:Glycosyl hydrolases family 39
MKKLGAVLLSMLVLLSVSDSNASVQLKPSPQPISASFFGMHIHNLVGRSRTGQLTPWPNVSVPTWRLWDAQVRWPDIEPSKGQWRFDTLDKYMALADAHHTDVLLPLGVTPQWASSQPDVKSGWQPPGLTAPPRDIGDWRDFVRKVATHCKGRIHEYEIWNEPNLKQYWVGTPEELVTLTHEAHDIIKGIDPSALIVSPAATTSAGVAWLEEFLSKGGSQYIDVVGYHLYVFPQAPEAMVAMIQRVKQAMANNGAGDKQLWCTEMGWLSPKPFPSDDLAAAYVARVYLLSWAAGVQRVYWYAWDNHGAVAIETTMEDNLTPRPAGVAFGTIQQWMTGTQMDWCNGSNDGTWSCQLERGGTPQWVVWNSSNATTFKIPSAWHVAGATDLLGQSQGVSGSNMQITPTPQLLTGSSQ